MARRNGYGQFCPVAMAAQVVAERWTPLVVRELLCGSTRFNDLQRGVPRMSSSLLAQRLKQLQYAGVVERSRSAAGVEYRLTAAGKELFPVVEAMGVWAQRWLRHELIAADNLDPDLLMWDIRRTVSAQERASSRRSAVEFQLSGVRRDRSRYWLVFDRGQVDLCFRDPGFEIELLVSSPLRTMTEVWLGHLTIEQAIREGRLRLEGEQHAIKAFGSWFSLSPFAPAARALANDAARAHRSPRQVRASRSSANAARKS